jgi:hypothetical protein
MHQLPRLLFRIVEGLDLRGWAIEHRHGAVTILCVAVHVCQSRWQQAIGLNTDLV